MVDKKVIQLGPRMAAKLELKLADQMAALMVNLLVGH